MHYSKTFGVDYPLTGMGKTTSAMWESLQFQCLGDPSERALETQIFLLHASSSLTTEVQCFKEGMVLSCLVNGTQIFLWLCSKECFKC